MIVIDNLSYWYPRTKSPAISGVKFEVSKGEMVLVTGQSGSGKSTLFYCLKGLVPHLYGGRLEGRVLLDDENLSEISVTEIAQRVGLVMQDPESQFCNLFVRDEVAFGVENLKLDPDVCLSRVQDALRVVGLVELAGKSVVELSGGEKQKVAVASILAMNVPILLLDEPTANLDAQSGREILGFIHRLSESGKTILLVQHKLDEMIHVADKLLILKEGTVLDFGPPRELIEKYGESLTTENNIGLPQIAHAALRTRKWFHFGNLPLTVEEFCAQVENPAEILSLPMHKSAVAKDGRGSILIEAEGLSYSYSASEKEAVNNFSMKVKAGEVVAIVGRNGSGKSTLARLLVGLLKPQKGSVKLRGRDTSELKRGDIHALTGYVFQYPEHQFLSDTVEKEIAYGLEVQERPKAEIKSTVNDVIESLKLTGKETRHPFCLSGGEKRRLSVATMLVLEPRLLILDEPTFGLDEGNLINLIRLLFEQLRERGITIIFITHDMRLVAEHAQRVFVMLDGQLLFDGSPAELFQDATMLDRAELLPPPIVELTLALKQCGYCLPPYLATLEEFTNAIDSIFIAENGKF